jgi:predicted phage-related endonuclease
MEVSVMSISDMNAAAKDLMSVRAMIRELEAEAEALTDKLKAAMVERSTETLEGDGWKATWKNVESRRFDSKAFKAQHGDLYESFTKPTITTRFVLTA